MARAEFANFAGGVHEADPVHCCHPEKFSIAANTLFRPSGDYSMRIRTQYPSACYGEQASNVRSQMTIFKNSPGWPFGKLGTKLYRCLAVRQHPNDANGTPQWGVDEWHHDHTEAGAQPTCFNLQVRTTGGKKYWSIYIRGGAGKGTFIQNIYGQPGVDANVVLWAGGLSPEVVIGEWWLFFFCWDMLADNAANGRFRAYACKNGGTMVNVVPTKNIPTAYTGMTNAYPTLGIYTPASVTVPSEYEWMAGAWFDNEAEAKAWFEDKVNYDVFDDGGAPPPPPPDPNAFSIIVPIAIAGDDGTVGVEGSSYPPTTTVDAETNLTTILTEKSFQAAAGQVVIENFDIRAFDFTTNPTFQFDTSGANAILVCVAKRFAGTNPTGCTFNGDTLTEILVEDTGGNRVKINFYFLLNPDAGLFNLIVTGASQQRYVIAAYALSNVHATTPHGTAVGDSGQGNPITVTVASATTELVIDMACYLADTDTTLVPDASQTLQGSVLRAVSGGNAVEAGSSTKQGAASTTMEWDEGIGNLFWSIGAVSIKPASGGGSAVYKTRRGYMRFDVAGDLPADADTITQAILRANVVSVDNIDARQLRVDWIQDPGTITTGDHDPTDPAGTGVIATLASLEPLEGTEVNFLLNNPDAFIPRAGYTGLRLGISGGVPFGKNAIELASLDHLTLDAPELVVSGTLTGTGNPPPASIPPPPFTQWFGYYSATDVLSPHGSTIDTVRAFLATLSEDGVVDRIAQWIEPQISVSGTELVKLAIWEDNAGVPGDIICYTEEIPISSTAPAGWYQGLVIGGPVQLPAASYWVGDMRGGVANLAYVRRLDTGGDFAYHTGQTYGATVPNFGTPTGTTDFKMLMAVNYSDPAAPPPVTVPVNTALPVITGAAIEDATLVCDGGQWQSTPGYPVTFDYQWLRCNASGGGCGNVGGHGGIAFATYIAQASDVGFTLRCQVTATNAAGSTIAISAPTAVIVEGDPPDPPDPPTEPDPDPPPGPGSDRPILVFEVAWNSSFSAPYGEAIKASAESYFRLKSSEITPPLVYDQKVVSEATEAGSGTITRNAAGTGPVIDGGSFEFPGFTGGTRRIDILWGPFTTMMEQLSQTASVECWIKPIWSPGIGTVPRVIMSRDGSLFLQFNHSVFSLRLTNEPDGIYIDHVLSTSLEDTWIHVCGVHTSTHMQLWLNGQKVQEVVSETSPLWSEQNANIGGYSGLPSFAGEIAEAAFYREPLQPEEIQLHYHSSQTISPSDWVWEDLSDRVIEFSTERGRQETLENIEPGVLQITLDNRDNALDVDNPNSPYYPNVKSGKWARLRAAWANVNYPVFQGFIEGFPPDWQGLSRNITIRVLDRSALFAHNEVLVSQAPVEYSGERVRRFLDLLAVAETDRIIDTGKSQVLELISDGTDLLAKITPWSHLQQVANDSELGLLYIDKAGRVVFEDRHRRLRGINTIIQGTFVGNDDMVLGEYPLISTEVTTSNEKLVNILNIAGPDNQLTSTRADGGSIRDNGPHGRSVSTLLASLADRDAYAAWVIERKKDARLDVRSITVAGQMSPVSMWPIILGLEISRKITVRIIPVGSDPEPIAKNLFIEGIHHTYSADEGWHTKLMTSPSDEFQFWILGQSHLGVDTRLVF